MYQPMFNGKAEQINDSRKGNQKQSSESSENILYEFIHQVTCIELEKQQKQPGIKRQKTKKY